MVMMVIDGDVLAGRRRDVDLSPGCRLTQQGCSRAIYTLAMTKTSPSITIITIIRLERHNRSKLQETHSPQRSLAGELV